MSGVGYRHKEEMLVVEREDELEIKSQNLYLKVQRVSAQSRQIWLTTQHTY